MANEIPILTGEILKIQPGDLVVLKSPRKLSANEIERLSELWKEIWKGNPPGSCIVLDDGMDLSVLRKAEGTDTK